LFLHHDGLAGRVAVAEAKAVVTLAAAVEGDQAGVCSHCHAMLGRHPLLGGSGRLGGLIKVGHFVIAEEILIADIGARGTPGKLRAGEFPGRVSGRSVGRRAAKEDRSITGIARSGHG
jgi:hypothetical protein